MGELVTVEDAHFAQMHEAILRYAKNEQPTTIAKALGIRRKDVLDYIDEWKSSSMGSEVMRQRTEELLGAMDEHYSELIRKLWEIVAETDEVEKTTPQWLAQKNSAIKQIADVEGKRIEILQKAGMFDDAEQAAHYADVERKQELMVKILQTDLCDVCRLKIGTKLRQISGEVEVIVVDQ